jgi:hypothetical protein
MYDLGLAVGFVNVWANEEESKRGKNFNMTQSQSYLGMESPKAQTIPNGLVTKRGSEY